MFSGIIECTSLTQSILSSGSSSEKDSLIRFQLKRPSLFSDLQIGDSISCNGVCLTIEDFNSDHIQFAIGAETLQVTGWDESQVSNMNWNLERSLKFGSRVHGHFVTGHVDFKGSIYRSLHQSEGLELWVKHPPSFRRFFWRKGSVALNGVSLTINEISKENTFRVNLIPETLKVTNLGQLIEEQGLNVEVDSYARGLIHYLEERRPNETSLD